MYADAFFDRGVAYYYKGNKTRHVLIGNELVN